MKGFKALDQSCSGIPSSDFNQICQWLGVGEGVWPPDHYCLLGLKKGEGDTQQIEFRVQECLRLVRRYQLSQPVLATEAMNQIARAYACLTDPGQKSEYDQSLPPGPSPRVEKITNSPKVASKKPLSPADTDSGSFSREMDWRQQGPPPVRQGDKEKNSQIPSQDPGMPPGKEACLQSENGILPSKEKKDNDFSLLQRKKGEKLSHSYAKLMARTSCLKKGLWHPRAIMQRLEKNRKLKQGWMLMKTCCLEKEGKRFSPPTLAQMRKGLSILEKELADFPPILGKPGTPGYRLAILAQDESPIREFQKMGLIEREALALDWGTGWALLQGHDQYLRQHLHGWKAHKSWHRPVYFLRNFFAEYQLYLWGIGLAAAALVLLTLLLF